eukprot:3618985-Rhodomonas_salina.2
MTNTDPAAAASCSKRKRRCDLQHRRAGSPPPLVFGDPALTSGKLLPGGLRDTSRRNSWTATRSSQTRRCTTCTRTTPWKGRMCRSVR